jgi:hypothetical protein
MRTSLAGEGRKEGGVLRGVIWRRIASSGAQDDVAFVFWMEGIRGVGTFDRYAHARSKTHTRGEGWLPGLADDIGHCPAPSLRATHRARD